VIKRYIAGLLKGTPMLRQLIEGETRETITLRNRIVIEIHTASFRSVRGYTVVATLLDEIAFWPTDEYSSNPDAEVINALKPAQATVPGAIMLCASSPHARKGALWEAYHGHFGKDGDPVLVWQAATREMNASVPQAYVDQHLAEDPSRARAEYLAQFRSDITAFVDIETVQALVVPGRRELLYAAGNQYLAFVDTSGGSQDAMTLGIAHYDRATKKVVLDLVRERQPPFSPEDVVAEFCAILQGYRINRVVGDRYAGEWPRERFRVHGVQYGVAEQSKSDIYRDALPLLNSGAAELLEVGRLVGQIGNLERSVARGTGRDTIDHPRGAHDDLANAALGALVLAAEQAARPVLSCEVMAEAAARARAMPHWRERQRMPAYF
jgi:hypothetical protein